MVHEEGFGSALESFLKGEHILLPPRVRVQSFLDHGIFGSGLLGYKRLVSLTIQPAVNLIIYDHI